MAVTTNKELTSLFEDFFEITGIHTGIWDINYQSIVRAIKIYYKLGFRPDLYQPDMRERWIWVMKELGWKEFDVVNESGVSETIVL